MSKMIDLPTCQFDTSTAEWNVVRAAFPISEIAKIVNTANAYLPNPEDMPCSQMFLKNGDIVELLCTCEDAVEKINNLLWSMIYNDL